MAESDVSGDGPWEVQWAWNTGYSGVDRFATSERTITFCDELFRRTDPPKLELARFSVINTETGERLPGRHELSDQVLESSQRLRDEGLMAKTCGTCNGSGTITIIQTGKTKACTRCNGTGKE